MKAIATMKGWHKKELARDEKELKNARVKLTKTMTRKAPKSVKLFFLQKEEQEQEDTVQFLEKAIASTKLSHEMMIARMQEQLKEARYQKGGKTRKARK